MKLSDWARAKGVCYKTAWLWWKKGQLLQRAGSHYIAGERLRAGKKGMEAALSRPGRYRRVRPNLEVKEIVVGTGEARERYILVRNREQAGHRAPPQGAAGEGGLRPSGASRLRPLPEAG